MTDRRTRREFLGTVGAAGALGAAGRAGAVEGDREPLAADWARDYGGPGDDSANTVVQLDEDRYLFAGATGSSGAGELDGWVVTVDGDGDPQREQTFGGTGSDGFMGSLATDDGGVLLSGTRSSGDDVGIGAWLCKLDDEGAVEWNRTYGGSTFDRAHAVVERPEGGYAFAGGKVGEGGILDGWLVAVDEQGREDWSLTEGGDGNEFFKDIVVTEDGEYLLAGRSESGDAAPGQAMLMKAGPDGPRWIRTYGGGGFDYAKGCATAHGGGYVFVGTKYLQEESDFDGWLVAVDETGDRRWERAYGRATADRGSADDVLDAVVQTAGGYVLAGRKGSLEEGVQDSWLLETDADGGLESEATYGTETPQDAHDVLPADDGSYLLAGHQVEPAGSDDGSQSWVVKTEQRERASPEGGGGSDDDGTLALLALGVLALLGVVVVALVALAAVVGGVVWYRRSGGSGTDTEQDGT